MSSWRKVRMAVYERDGGRCQDCGVSVPVDGFECHHVVERKLGGSDEPENLRTLCADCHKPHTSRFASNRRVARKMNVVTEYGQTVKASRPKSWRPIPSRPLPKGRKLRWTK